MRTMIISDLHGSEQTTRQALKYFGELNCDRLLILGDILYHGPRNPIPQGHNPQGVVELLNPLKDKIIAVRGNCEAEVDQMLLEFPCMADYALIEEEGIRIFATHGHLYNPGKLPFLPTGALFLYGHTHLWEVCREKGITICNPGSITLPKQGREATFAIYEAGIISVHRLEDGVRLASLPVKEA